MFEALAVALGGALGSLGRWQLGVLFKQWIPNLPVGTFAANVVAGLIIGFVTGLDLCKSTSAAGQAILSRGPLRRTFDFLDLLKMKLLPLFKQAIGLLQV